MDLRATTTRDALAARRTATMAPVFPEDLDSGLSMFQTPRKAPENDAEARTPSRSASSSNNSKPIPHFRLRPQGGALQAFQKVARIGGSSSSLSPCRRLVQGTTNREPPAVILRGSCSLSQTEFLPMPNQDLEPDVIRKLELPEDLEDDNDDMKRVISQRKPKLEFRPSKRSCLERDLLA